MTVFFVLASTLENAQSGSFGSIAYEWYFYEVLAYLKIFKFDMVLSFEIKLDFFFLILFFQYFLTVISSCLFTMAPNYSCHFFTAPYLSNFANKKMVFSLQENTIVEVYKAYSTAKMFAIASCSRLLTTGPCRSPNFFYCFVRNIYILINPVW